MNKKIRLLFSVKWLCGSLLLLVITGCDFSSYLHREVLRAQNEELQQNYLKSSQIYEKILAQNPPPKLKTKVLFQLGKINFYFLGRIPEALNYFQKIVEISINPIWSVKSYEKMGRIYFHFLKDYAKSAEVYQILVQFKPKLSQNDFYEYRLALSYLHLNRYDESRKILSQIIINKRHKYNKRAYFYLGLTYYYEQEYLMSIQIWKKYLQLENRRDWVNETKFLMANSYETIEKLKESYELYYSLQNIYSDSNIIDKRLQSIYKRRVARKR